MQHKLLDTPKLRANKEMHDKKNANQNNAVIK